MDSPHRRLWRWILVILWMALIFFFSAQSAESSNAMSDPFAATAGRLYQWIRGLFPALPDASAQALVLLTRKAAHAFLYFTLAVWTFFAVRGHTKKLSLCASVSFGICTLYAVSDELHQSFLPGRAMRAGDVLIDALAALCAIALLWALIGVRKRRKKVAQ